MTAGVDLSAATAVATSTRRPSHRTMQRSTARDSALTLTELSCLASEFGDFFASGGLWRTWRQLSPPRSGNGRAGWSSRLYADDGVDVWLVTWGASQRTRPHGHGRSGAALTVVHGELEIVRGRRAAPLTREVLRAGDTATTRPGIVHDVHNTTDEVTVSIHAYSPALPCRTEPTVGTSGLGVVRAIADSTRAAEARR